MRYRVYYADGTYIDSDTTGVSSLRPIGVLVIVQFDTYTEHWYLQHSSDNYIWRDDRWVGVDDTGRTVYLVEPGWKRVLFGETVRNQVWLKAFAEAQAFRDQLDREHVRPTA